MTKTEVKKKCLHCGKPLHIIPWNSVVDLIACGNNNCLLYHRPRGSQPATEETIKQWNKERKKQVKTFVKRNR